MSKNQGSQGEAQSTAVSVFVLLLSVLLLSAVFAVYVTSSDAREQPKSTLSSSWDGHGLTVNVVVAGNVDRLTVSGFKNSSAVRSGSWTPLGPEMLVLTGDDIGPGAAFRVEPGEAVEPAGHLVVEGHIGEDSRVLEVFQVSD